MKYVYKLTTYHPETRRPQVTWFAHKYQATAWVHSVFTDGQDYEIRAYPIPLRSLSKAHALYVLDGGRVIDEDASELIDHSLA